MSGSIQGRQNWTRSLTVVVIAAVIAVAIGFMVDVKANKTDRLYFNNSGGAVLFDHGKHSQSAESCAKCHHDLYSAAQATLCAECHDDELEAADFSHNELKDAHSQDCSRCHEQTKESDQATSCRECHPGMQQSETFTVNCTECHDDGYSPEMLTHDEYQEMDEHSCLGCHTPRAVSEAYHTNCSNCHLETAREKFTLAGGEVRCGACHLQ